MADHPSRRRAAGSLELRELRIAALREAIVSAAQSAFETFAENFACMYAESAPEKTILIKAGSEEDEDIAAFVLKKLSSEDEKSLLKKNTKDQVKWLSVSGKEEGALSFFKRL